MNTGLDRPFGGAFDSDGNLYIPSGESNSVLVFATADLTGTGNLNLTPVRTIKGGNTGLALPAGVAFDGNGDLYVAQQIGPVEVFAAADLVGTGELDLNHCAQSSCLRQEVGSSFLTTTEICMSAPASRWSHSVPLI
ncbi:MAG TPA: hypothetical protein PK635_03370 [Actinomycetota bacterium]|nr:hypothetical protein [Actinomycetota bacterium]